MTETTPTSLLVVDQYGKPMPMPTAARAQGMDTRPFNPGLPQRPYGDQYGVPPREQDFMSGYNIAARPRRDERVSFDTLRGLIEAYDIAQICIWHRINSVRSLAWSLVGKPGADGAGIEGQIEYGRRVLTRLDGITPFATWLAAYLYDVLAYDAGCIYRIRNNAGRVIGMKVIDGTTIAPLLNYYGGTPLPPAPAFVQYSQGVVWDWLSTDDLIYVPYQPTSNSPYGRAPIETVLLNANTDLRLQSYFLQRFTSGNVPEAFATSPEGWGPDQIEEFQTAWDALLYGDPEAKHQIRWTPHGTTFAWSNEKEFSAGFSEFLAVKTAGAYHVVPSDIGILSDVNRATSETQADVQFRIGDLPLIQHVEGILSRFLQDDLGLPLNFAFDTGQEKEDRLNTAQANKIYIDAGVIGISEVREDVFGLSEPDGEPIPRFINNNKLGPVPLAQLKQLAGPTDPETGAPLPSAVPAAAPPGTAAIGPGSSVAKAETVGSVEETGAYGNPLLRDDDEPDDEPTLAVVKAELATFDRFVRERARRRRWRDFDFAVIDHRIGHRLNQAGRGQVLKAEGQIVAAGLAVAAADTGRVLMLQRALDPADPAAGTWEMPGGCLEDGEDPWAAACREWQEETGCVLPDGQRASSWTSANGVYVGFVWQVPTEAGVGINLESGRVLNPDDPDGDQVETCAWWDPAQMVGNPAVRSELAADVEVVLAALTGTAQVVKADPKGSWRDADNAPQHAYDLRLTDHYTPVVLAALRAMFAPAAVRAAIASAVEQYPAPVAKAADPADASAALADAISAAVVVSLTADTDSIAAALRKIAADAYLAGLHTAAEQTGGYVASELGNVAADIDWGTWKPGDPAAALKASGGALKGLLDAQGATVRDITDETLTRIGNAVGNGLLSGSSVDDVADSISTLLDDESRAEMIAHTETARAVDAATLDTYTANGVELYDVLIADGACEECVDVADNNPYPVFDGGQVPIHPRCRCASAPHIEES